MGLLLGAMVVVECTGCDFKSNQIGLAGTRCIECVHGILYWKFEKVKGNDENDHTHKRDVLTRPRRREWMSRSTYTYAILEISQAAYDEIKEKLERGGYQSQFHEHGGRLVIDMHGLAVAPEYAGDPGDGKISIL